MGILIARHHWTYDHASDMLRDASQRSHRKLRDVADDVLFTGALPTRPTQDKMPGTGSAA